MPLSEIPGFSSSRRKGRSYLLAGEPYPRMAEARFRLRRCAAPKRGKARQPSNQIGSEQVHKRSVPAPAAAYAAAARQQSAVLVAPNCSAHYAIVQKPYCNRFWL